MSAEFDLYHYRSRKNKLMILTIIFLSGISAFYLIEKPKNYFLVAAIAGFFSQLVACCWVYFDGLEREKPIGVPWVVGVFLFTPLALPLYLMTSRGFQAFYSFGGLLMLLFSIALFGFGIFYIHENSDTIQAVWEVIQPPESLDLRL